MKGTRWQHDSVSDPKALEGLLVAGFGPLWCLFVMGIETFRPKSCPYSGLSPFILSFQGHVTFRANRRQKLLLGFDPFYTLDFQPPLKSDKNTYRLILDLFILRLVRSQAPGGSRPNALIFAESVYVCLSRWNYNRTCQTERGKSSGRECVSEHPLLVFILFIHQAARSLVHETETEINVNHESLLGVKVMSLKKQGQNK